MAQNPQGTINVNLSDLDSNHPSRSARDSDDDSDPPRYFGLAYGDGIPLLPHPENHSSQRALGLVIFLTFLLNTFKLK